MTHAAYYAPLAQACEAAGYTSMTIPDSALRRAVRRATGGCTPEATARSSTACSSGSRRSARGGDDRDDFEVHVISFDAYTPEGGEAAGGQGRHRLHLRLPDPLPQGPDTEPLETKVKHIEQYAENVITEYETHQTSLTKAQADTDPDGSMRFVISSKAPYDGRPVANWLETTHHPTGAIMLRWQKLTRDLTAADGPRVEVVKLAEVPGRLPDTKPLTDEEYAGRLAARQRAVARRMISRGPGFPVAGGALEGSCAVVGACTASRRFSPCCSPLLTDKVVVLSGVGPGLGRALSEQAALMGADLMLASRTEKRLEKIAAAVREHGRARVAAQPLHPRHRKDDAQTWSLLRRRRPTGARHSPDRQAGPRYVHAP